MTISYSDVELLSKYSPVMLNLSPATRILSENPVCILVAKMCDQPSVWDC